MKSIILLLALASITLCDIYYQDPIHRNYCCCTDTKIAHVVRDSYNCSGKNFSYKHMRTTEEIKADGFDTIKSNYLDGSVFCGLTQTPDVCPCPKFECQDPVCKENERLKTYQNENGCEIKCSECISDCPKTNCEIVNCGPTERYIPPKTDKNGCSKDCGKCESICTEPQCENLECSTGLVSTPQLDPLGCNACPKCECPKLDCSNEPTECEKNHMLITPVNEAGCKQCKVCKIIDPCEKKPDCKDAPKTCDEKHDLFTPKDNNNCEQCPICRPKPCQVCTNQPIKNEDCQSDEIVKKGKEGTDGCVACNVCEHDDCNYPVCPDGTPKKPEDCPPNHYLVETERDSKNCLKCPFCRELGTECDEDKKCGKEPICKETHKLDVKKDKKGCDKCPECEKVKCPVLKCATLVPQPGQEIKTGIVDKHKCPLCDEIVDIPCQKIEDQNCEPLTCDKSKEIKSFDKDGCPNCPTKCECPKLSCTKDLECNAPNKVVKNKDANQCPLCDTCPDVPPPKPCPELEGDRCKLDMRIVELYNSKFQLTRRLSTAMKKLAWNRCMNHRQLQQVNRLSLDENNPTDADIMKQLAERKQLSLFIDGPACKKKGDSKNNAAP